MKTDRLKTFATSFALASALTAGGTALHMEEAEAMGLMNPANPISPLNPVSPISIYGDDETKEEKERRKAEKEARQKRVNTVWAGVRETVADPNSDASDIKASFQGINFRDFDADDTHYLDACRQEVLSDVYKKASNDEVSELIDCMHEKDGDAKTGKVLKAVGTIGLGGALLVGGIVAYNRRPSP